MYINLRDGNTFTGRSRGGFSRGSICRLRSVRDNLRSRDGTRETEDVRSRSVDSGLEQRVGFVAFSSNGKLVSSLGNHIFSVNQLIGAVEGSLWTWGY